MRPDLTEFQTTVLTAVVEGYRDREGLKDRMRALNEWEIARRTGYELTFAEFLEHPARERIMQALSTLQQHGLVGVWERGAKYDSFVPTATGTDALSRAGDASPAPEAAARAHPDDTPSDPVVERLDEVIRLLRSIDSKLGGP